MNLTETRDLVETMALVWPTMRADTETITTWAGKLATIDTDTATRAADMLVDSGREWPPTLSQMVDACRRLATDAARTRRARRGTCGRCDGAGWIEVGHDRDANRVIPCADCLPTTTERRQARRDGYDGPVYTGGRPRASGTEAELNRDGLVLARQALTDAIHPPQDAS